jgi:hypothetical protein
VEVEGDVVATITPCWESGEAAAALKLGQKHLRRYREDLYLHELDGNPNPFP